jgi:hypothetical protein
MSDEKDEPLPPYEARVLAPREKRFENPFPEPPLRPRTELAEELREVREQLKADPLNETLLGRERDLKTELIPRLGEDLPEE